MNRQNGFGVVGIIIAIIIVVGIVGGVGYMAWNNKLGNNSTHNSGPVVSEGPNGVKIIEEWCIDENMEGGPACIPAHYYDLVDIVTIRNDDHSIKEVYVDGEYVSGDDWSNINRKWSEKITILEKEKCRQLGGNYEKVYVGGVAGMNNLCLVKMQLW